MGVLMHVLALAASDSAKTPWERQFAVWICGHDQNFMGIGLVSFDIDDIGWTIEAFPTEKRFVVSAIDMAMKEHRWSDLGYTPVSIKESLQAFKSIVEAFQVDFIEPERAWRFEDDEPARALCPKHHIYLSEWGCIICNDMPIA
jgi:hypothetical protein